MKNLGRSGLMLLGGVALLHAQPTPLRIAVEKATAELPAGRLCEGRG
jgi:hypothetical protein